MAARPPEFEDFMSPIANQNDEAVALRVFVATVAGILVAGIAAGWLFGLAGIGVLAMIATALMLLLTVVITLG
jgi:predicted lipid-binding transport protein (Tim44 family)